MHRVLPSPLTLTFVFAAAFAARARASDTLYATSGPINPSLLTLDPSNGAITNSVSITGAQALFGGLAWNGTALYSIDGYNDAFSDRTFKIDATTGSGGIVGDTGFNWNFRSVEFDPANGVLYAMTDNSLYKLDTSTGAASLVAPITGSTLDQATALAIDSLGHAWITDIGGQGLFRLDLTTGNATHVGDLNLNPNYGYFFQDLACDSSGQLFGVWLLGGVYKIDTVASSASLAWSSGAFGGIAFRSDCTPTNYCTAKLNSLGCTPAISMTGTPSASSGSGCNLTTSNLIGKKNGLYFHSTLGGSSAPFHGGFLCVKTPIKRHPLKNSGGTAGTCNGVILEDFNAYIATGADPALVAGAKVWLQNWSRDPSDPFTDSLSNGVTTSICP